MILGQLAVTNLPLLSISSQTTERATSFKLLGLHIDTSLSWSTVGSGLRPTYSLLGA